MPTYVYRRPDGTTFEIFQRISDTPLTEDPDSGEPVHRVISGGAGLQFKGDGFYLTDYARKNSSPSNGSSNGSSGESSNGSSNGSESSSNGSAKSSTSVSTSA